MRSSPSLDVPGMLLIGSDSKSGLLSPPRVFSLTTRASTHPPPGRGPNFAMNDATTSLLTEHFSYTPLVSVSAKDFVSLAARALCSRAFRPRRLGNNMLTYFPVAHR